MIDIPMRQQLTIATGGTRGDVVTTTADGRVLVSQSNQIDVLTTTLQPQVIADIPDNRASENRLENVFEVLNI